MKDKNWVKSPWTISLATAIFSLLLTMGYDYSKSEPILTTIFGFLNTIWTFLITVLNFDLKIWWMLVALAVFFGALYVIDKFKTEETFKPDFYNYREDKFKRWRWTWSWKLNQSKNVWMISELKAHCPDCNTPMIENESIHGLSFECPRCDFKASDSQSDKPYKIERIIRDNINRKKQESTLYEKEN